MDDLVIKVTPYINSKKSKYKLLRNTQIHINNVKKGFICIKKIINATIEMHDSDKIKFLDQYYTNELNDINHKIQSRHHLDKKSPIKVNLIDILEYIIDQSILNVENKTNNQIEIDSEILMRAFNNTCSFIQKFIKVGK